MTDDRTKKGDKFVNDYLDSMPEQLSLEHVVRIACGTIAAFSTGPSDAAKTLAICVTELQRFYAENDDIDCNCPECVAKRNIH